MTLDIITIPPVNGSKPKYSIVALHGWGSNPRDLAALAPNFNLPDYQFILPSAPFPHPVMPGGKAWYSFENKDYRGLSESRQLLQEFLQTLESTSEIPLSRTILSGFSQGGAMALDVGLNFPLAGLCSLSGYLHSTPTTVNSDNCPPVLIVHGSRDPIVPIEAAQKAKNTLRDRGVKVEYREFEMGHEIQPPVIELMQRFIIANAAPEAKSN